MPNEKKYLYCTSNDYTLLKAIYSAQIMEFWVRYSNAKIIRHISRNIAFHSNCFLSVIFIHSCLVGYFKGSFFICRHLRYNVVFHVDKWRRKHQNTRPIFFITEVIWICWPMYYIALSQKGLKSYNVISFISNYLTTPL